MDIYNTAKYLESAIGKVRSEPGINEADRAAILRFLSDSASNGLKPRRVLKYALVMRYLAKLYPGSVTELTEGGARELVRRIDARDELSPWTRMDYKMIFRAFVKWLRKSDEVPPEIRWMRARVSRSETKLPEDLLTPAEVVALANAASTLRDRALLTVLYESGARIGELLTMRIGAVRADPNGAALTVYGKTGGRRILIVESAPALFAWIAVHPRARDPAAPLWIGHGSKAMNEPITHGAVLRVVQVAARKAGISKRVHPHLFRHSRASFLASKFTEAQMNAYFGWTQGSDMTRVYVHLSGRDVDGAVLALYGLRRADDPLASGAAVPACPRCRAALLANAVSCPRCWLPLVPHVEPATSKHPASTKEMAISLVERLLDDPRFVKLLAEEKARAESEHREPETVWPKPVPRRAA